MEAGVIVCGISLQETNNMQIYVLSKKSKQLTGFDCENYLFLVVSCLFWKEDVSSLDIFFYNIRNLFKAIKLMVMNPPKRVACFFYLSCYLNKYKQKPECILWGKNIGSLQKKSAVVIIYLIMERMDWKYS